MGGKYTWKRKHVFFYYSGLIVIVLMVSGCAITSRCTYKCQAYVYLEEAERNMIEGEYSVATENNQQALAISPKSAPGDKALFNLGLIFAHPDNPQRSRKKSLKFFAAVSSDFPQSELATRARIWSATLTMLNRMDAKVNKLQKDNVILQQQIKENNKTIGMLKKQLMRIKEIDIITEEGKRQGFAE